MPAFVLFAIDAQTFALPAGQVAAVHRNAAATPVPGAPPFVRGLLNLRGELVPVLEVRARLGLGARPPRASDHLLLVEDGPGRVLLEVDRVLELRELPGEDGRPVPGGLARGAVRTPEGAVVVHDAAAWVAEAGAALGGARAGGGHGRT